MLQQKWTHAYENYIIHESGRNCSSWSLHALCIFEYIHKNMPCIQYMPICTEANLQAYRRTLLHGMAYMRTRYEWDKVLKLQMMCVLHNYMHATFCQHTHMHAIVYTGIQWHEYSHTGTHLPTFSHTCMCMHKVNECLHLNDFFPMWVSVYLMLASVLKPSWSYFCIHPHMYVHVFAIQYIIRSLTTRFIWWNNVFPSVYIHIFDFLTYMCTSENFHEIVVVYSSIYACLHAMKDVRICMHASISDYPEREKIIFITHFQFHFPSQMTMIIQRENQWRLEDMLLLSEMCFWGVQVIWDGTLWF